MSYFRIKTPLKIVIERLQSIVDSSPTNSKKNRARREAYVHSIEIIKELLHLEEEERKLIIADFVATINRGIQE